MKIMLVNTYYDPDIIGGAEISVKKMAEGLAAKGNEVVILCTSECNKVDFQSSIRIIRRHFKNIISYIKYKKSGKIKKAIFKAIDYYNFVNKLEIAKILDDEKPDIIHTNNLMGISASIWKVAKKKNIPVIHTLRDYLLMCPRASLMKNDGSECNECAELCKIYRRGLRKCSKNVDFVTAPSLCTLSRFVNEGYFQNSYKKVIYNAIDYDINETKRYCFERKKQINKRDFNIIYIGGLYEHKGIKFLLDAFELIDSENVTLNIAGKGELLSYVQKMQSKDSRIKYHGFLNEADLRKLLEANDLLIIPSLWQEPFGRVILDAYRACIPVIGTDLGGIPELIVDGKTGFLVEPNKTEMMAKRIVELYSTKRLYNEMLDNVVKQIENYSITKQIEKFEECYEQIIEFNVFGENKKFI